jgi:hypothetical protein
MDNCTAVPYIGDPFQDAQVHDRCRQLQVGVGKPPVWVRFRDDFVADIVGKDYPPDRGSEGLGAAKPDTACSERARITVADVVVPVTD